MAKRVGVALTKRVVDAAEKRDRRYFVWDSELSGFGLRVEKSGAKTFIVRYRAEGGGRSAAQRFVTIGRLGTLTCKTIPLGGPPIGYRRKYLPRSPETRHHKSFRGKPQLQKTWSVSTGC
ncbi:MAG: DUF4102 domain-containing protein, partial [Mesorhizobium sp.]